MSSLGTQKRRQIQQKCSWWASFVTLRSRKLRRDTWHIFIKSCLQLGEKEVVCFMSRRHQPDRWGASPLCSDLSFFIWPLRETQKIFHNLFSDSNSVKMCLMIESDIQNRKFICDNNDHVSCFIPRRNIFLSWQKKSVGLFVKYSFVAPSIKLPSLIYQV